MPAIEINAGKADHGSSVKVWLYEEFLTKEECEQLIKVHDSHVTEMKKNKVYSLLKCNLKLVQN